MEKKQRLYYVDVARGIAMICIVLGHLGIPEINHVVFTFHVPIFYLITGYYMNCNTTKREFVRKKIVTIIVPYIVTCIMIMLGSIIINELFMDGVGTKEIAKHWIRASLYGSGDNYSNPFVIEKIGAIWFLLATFWGSIFLRKLLELKQGTRIVAVMIIFALCSWSRWIIWLPLSIQAGGCALLFMYIGYLIKQMIPAVKNITLEAKVAFSILAIAAWICFIGNFESFYLVHCDIGRGGLDLLGSLCGCYGVLLISWVIEKKLKYLTKFLSYIGRYSLIVLCAHIFEQNLFPWNLLKDFLAGYELSWMFLYAKIIGKFVWILPIMYIFSKCSFTRKIFGYAAINKK